MKKLKLFFALFAMLALGVGNAWAESETVTFTNKDGAPWTKITSGSSFESADPSRGVANNGVNGSCKSSKSYSNITKISYVASSNTTGGKVTIKVGETTVGETSIPKVNNETFEYAVDNLSGVITLSVTKPSSKTVYVKSITIETSTATPDPTPVTISLNKTELNLQAGATETLTATIIGSTESVTWSSSATGVASVDNTGKVTAVAAGNATITAAIGDVKATCAVTVTAATTPEEPGTGGETTTVTYVFKDDSNCPGNDKTWFSGTIDEYTGWTATKGTNDPKYYNTGTGLRVYNGGTFTITSTKVMTSITLTFSDTGYTFSSSNTDNPQTVTPNAQSYEWSVSGTCRLQKIEITYAADAGGSDEPEAEIVKTLESIAVSDMTTIYEQGDAFSFDGKCTATYSVTIDGAAQDDPQTAIVTPTSVSTPDMNQLGTQTVTVTYTEGEVTRTADYTITIEEAPTYDFRKIDMSKWGTGYQGRVVPYEDATVTFASASKQSGTITDQPVTKGGDVSLVLTDGMNIATVKWVCTQWGAKAKTITLHYSKDGGNVYTSTGITSTDFTISSDNLPAGTNAVKITFNSTSNQVGIKSCTITKVEAAAITQVPAPQFSLQGGAYDGAQSVELTCTMADATIYYTTDGNDPTTSSSVYSTAIQVTESMTIKAYAVKEGLEDSPVVEATYEISAPADVVLDFTTNTWSLPEGNANKATEKTDFTNGDYTVSIAAPTAYYFDSNNLFLGKKDAYIVLPIFNKPIVKIVCEGVSSGSGSVTFNVFVDDEPVSTAVTSCKVDQTFLIAEDNQVANVAHVIKVTNAQNVRFSKIKIYLGEAPAVERPVIAGEEEFAGSTEVSITCATSGAKIYYTTDGTTPTDASPEYTTPFELTETKTVKAIAYVDGQASAVATKTFTKQELVDVATAMALAKDEIAYFDEFEVVKKVEGKGYIYIKDASGHGLIFDYDLESALKDGDRVKGFVGISSPYNNLPEMKPYNVTATDLTITSGTAAEPYDFSSTAIAAEHMNKYVVFKGVEMTEDVDITSHPTLTIGGNSVYLRNQFGKSVTLTSGVKYDIYAFVAIYNTTLQYYFYQANEEGEAPVKYTVTYNAGGATGTVPVDNNQYAAGDQVYLESALSLSYEGYEYKGWKVTDVNGNEILVSNNRFNMPASNVTITAQWEAIVVTPKEDFSAGVWVLVSDANELAADDYIIVAAKDYNVAMVSYDYDVRKNNCGQTNITKFGKDNCFLTWTEDVGVFQLTASGENYTIQDVNTKQYLYAAGGTTSNHLKATDAVDTDAENMPKYIWEISIVDGITTVKAMSEGRNTLKYNSAATSGQFFSCYASGQKDIVLYKYTTDFYTRDVTKNQYGTICLDKGGVPVSGATFYEVAYKNTQTKRVLVDEVVRLKAGVPYVFLPNANQIKIALDGTTAGTASKVNGLQGTFEDITDGPAGTAGNILEGKHVLYNNAIQKCGGNCQLPAYRAYFLVDEITTTEPAQVPGRRRVALDYQGENQATGLDNIGAPENDAVKVLMNGQMIIIRNGEKFNAQGVKL